MKRIQTVQAVEAVFSPSSGPKPGTQNPEPAHQVRTGPQAHRDLARAMVASIEQQMLTIGWFLETSRTYTVPLSGWPEILASAAHCRMTLAIAETLLRADHTTSHEHAAGARTQAAA